MSTRPWTEAGPNGFGLSVWWDDEPIPGFPPVWRWSSTRFLHPEDSNDDRVLWLGGEARTRLAAISAAKRAARKHR